MKRTITVLLAVLMLCAAFLPCAAFAAESDAKPIETPYAYTVKVYYDFHCDEEQTMVLYFNKGDYIEVEDILPYFMKCYCDFCKKRVDAHDEDREYCPECYRNGCNQFTYLKCLGTDILAEEKGGAIHVYFASRVVKVHAYRFYGNRTDNENAVNNAKATYKHIASEGILYVAMLITATFGVILHSWGNVADFKEARRKRAEMDEDILMQRRKDMLKDAEKQAAPERSDE